MSRASRRWFTIFALATLAFAPLVPLTPAEEAEEAAPEEEIQESELVEEVVVSAFRADPDSPATHTNLSRERIAEAQWAQDMPALLRLTPSVHHYADAGVDLGYSYLSVRGFDQRRVAVTINGVPLNGAETHQVYWVDLPNFADSLEDIQVQRGAGLNAYGAGAIGGSVNLETARLGPDETWEAEIGYGSYATSKVHASWSSGLLGEHWVVGAALSRLASDGYRDDAGVRMGMAFFTAQRLDDDSVLRINVYGGREETDLAYLGLTRQQLREDRRQNPLDEQDTFTQPHFQLIHEWTPRESLRIDNTLYAFHGRGKFDQSAESLFAYELKVGDPLLAGETLLGVSRERWIDEWDFGWVPKVTWMRGALELVAGAELRFHRGHQWGDVQAETTPAGLDDEFRYYDYRIPKDSLTLYVQGEWRPTPSLTLVAGLQRVRHAWQLEDELDDDNVADESYTRFSYDVEYSWWAPRLGLSWQASPAWSAFVSAAESRREPTVLDLYNIQEWYESPAFEDIGGSGRLSDPIPREERLRDYELGVSYRSPRLAAKATLYEMRFRDEIVFLGALNDIGLPVSGNSERSLHRGIELEAVGRLARDWQIRAHATFSRDEHLAFIEQVYDASFNLIDVDRSGKRVAGFPERLGRLALIWTPPRTRVELGALHTGRIYVDNSETRERSVDPYTVVHLDAERELTEDARLALRLRVNNLLDHEYESYGYFFGVEPTFIPAAGRHLFVSLSYRP